MNFFWAALLGILQGLTEFLPVSSSGHLVIAQNLIPDFTQPGVLFYVVLHAGTLLAIIIYFRDTILKITGRYLLLLAIGTVPAAIFGLLFQSAIERLFLSTLFVGFALLVTGALNYLTDIAAKKTDKLTVKLSWLVGFAQAFAIIPGVSRSGTTIFTATRLGLEREKAAEFSFLLSVPAVLGATILEALTYAKTSDINLSFYFVGFLAALMSGYLAIGVVLKILKEKRFRLFAIYCLVVGSLVILLS